jgi:hypothetical protein
MSEAAIANVARNVHSLLCEGGHILLMEHGLLSEYSGVKRTLGHPLSHNLAADSDSDDAVLVNVEVSLKDCHSTTFNDPLFKTFADASSNLRTLRTTKI